MPKIAQVRKKDVFRLSENFLELCFDFDSGFLTTGQDAGQVKTFVDRTNVGKATGKRRE